MNTNEKFKLNNRAAYIVLALLVVAIIAVTVIAVATTVGNRTDAPLPPDPGSTETPANTEPDESDNNDAPDIQKPGEEDKDIAPQRKYQAPASGAVQKGYSEDVLVFSATMNDHRIHLGIDINGKMGDPVYAFTGGTVEKVYTDPFMGKTVIIDHGNGLKSYYMNLADTLPEGISAGVGVTGGTVIGAIGETAISECSDEPHLHFELRVNDKRVDPAAYITVPSMAEIIPEYED